VNATSISFGGVVLNNPTTQMLAHTSTGTAPVTVKSITVTGSGFSASSVSLPANLNPGQTITVTLTFNPSVAGSATGQVSIGSNSSTNPTATVALSGTGNPHVIDLSWQAPSGSSVPIAGYYVYRAPSGTSSFAKLNSMSAQTAYADSSVQSGQRYDYYVTSVDSSGTESSPSNTTTVAVP
jgi:predicted phage tail protein